MKWRHRLEAWLFKVWFNKHQPAWPGRALLKLGSLLYRWFTQRQRNTAAIQQAKRPIHARQAPLVLVVGNVVVGGAGKTPVVLAVVQHLQAQGVAVGVVSRGFGRSNQAPQLINPQHLAGTKAQDVGDEPLWLAQRTGCPVAVGAKRQAALQCLLTAYPTLQCVVSDDGLQHAGLQRDLEWLVFDERGAGNQLLLPQGPLREPLTRLHSVDAILASNLSPETLAQNLNTHPDNRWHGVQVRIEGFVQHTAGQAPVRLNPQEAVALWGQQPQALRAFAGLGNPNKWFKALRGLGLALPPSQTTALPDHFHYPSNFCDAFAEKVLITTEKDAVKLLPNPRMWVAIVAVTLPPNLLHTLDEAVLHVHRKQFKQTL